MDLATDDVISVIGNCRVLSTAKALLNWKGGEQQKKKKKKRKFFKVECCLNWFWELLFLLQNYKGVVIELKFLAIFLSQCNGLSIDDLYERA